MGVVSLSLIHVTVRCTFGIIAYTLTCIYIRVHIERKISVNTLACEQNTRRSVSHASHRDIIPPVLLPLSLSRIVSPSLSVLPFLSLSLRYSCAYSLDRSRSSLGLPLPLTSALLVITKRHIES